MNTLIRFFNPFAHAQSQDALYDVVENEEIKEQDLSGLTLSGSLFSLSVFRDVTFTACVFFGSRLENCTFIGCKFIDCSFQFSTVEHCTFEETEFVGSHWDVSPLKKNAFRTCFLDQKTAYFAQKNYAANKLQGSVHSTGPLAIEEEGDIWQSEWHHDGHLEGGEYIPSLPPLPTEDNGPTKTLYRGGSKAA